MVAGFEPFEPCWISTSEWSHFDAFHAVDLALDRGFLSEIPALSHHSSLVVSESTLSRRQRAKADWYCAKFLSIYRSRSFLRPYRSRLLKADGRLRDFISNSFSLRRRAFERANTRFHNFFSSFWSRVAGLVVQNWCDAPTINFALLLSDDDRALARKWRTDDSPDEDDRVYNARRAELSASSYYRGLRYSVVDVSLQQLHSVEDGDWRTHDLEVSGRPVDVKNLRGDPGRRGFIVPPHQKTRRRGTVVERVVICGLVTQASGSPPVQQVIGEVTESHVRELAYAVEHLACALGLRLRLTSMIEWTRYLGPWLMDYPPSHYRSLDCSWLCSDIQSAKSIGLVPPCPTWARVLSVFWGSAHRKSLSSLDVRAPVSDVFSQAIRSMPRSRGAIVFFVILYLLAVVRRGVWRPTTTRHNLLDTLFLPDELVNDRIDR